MVKPSFTLSKKTVSSVETPDAGYVGVFVGSDGKVYTKDENGVSQEVGNYTELLTDSVPGCEALFSKKRGADVEDWAVVRNASNQEMTISFDGDWPDTDELLGFANGGSLWIKTLYDQSGRGRHITQATAAAQPRFLLTGAPTSVEYNAGFVFDGSNDVLRTAGNVVSLDTLTALCEINALSGNDKTAFAVGTSTSGEQNWYAPLTNSSGQTRVGTTDGFDLYDRTLSGRYGVGVYCNPIPTPIYMSTKSATGWTRTLDQAVAGDFTNGPLSLGGQATAFATLQTSGAAFWNRDLTSSELILAGQGLGFGASGIVLGDSTIASYDGQNEIAFYLMTTANQIRSYGCKSLAVLGHTIAQQQAAYLAYIGKQFAEWVVIQVGLNDMNPSIATATTIAALQELVNVVRRSSPLAKVVVATMTPAYERWPNVPWDQTTAQAKWVAVNAAIKGQGSTPIVGVDARVSSHTDALTIDVSGNAALNPIYYSPANDAIHTNNAARAISAAAWETALRSLGFF